MGRKDLSNLRAGLKRGMEIDRSIASLTEKRDSLNRSKRKKKSEIEKIPDKPALAIDPSTLTVKKLKQILGEHDLPKGGVKKQLVERLAENNIDLGIDAGSKSIQNIGDLEPKLLELKDTIKALNSQIKEQELSLGPYREKEKDASSRVEKAKNSWIYTKDDGYVSGNQKKFDVFNYIWMLFLGIFLAGAGMAIWELLLSVGVVVENENVMSVPEIVYVSWVTFFCCLFPFLGGTFLLILQLVYDPAGNAVELHNSAKDELRKEEAPLNNLKMELSSVKGQITRIEIMKDRTEANRLEIEKGRKEIERLEVEIEDLNLEISKLRTELKEVYADIKHLLPYSYMLE